MSESAGSSGVCSLLITVCVCVCERERVSVCVCVCAVSLLDPVECVHF